MINESALPDGWELKKVKDVIDRAINGGTPPRSNSEYWGGDIDWLSSGEIRGKEIYQANESITNKALEESSAKLFPKNSVLVAMYGDGDTKGRTAINREVLSGNQAICCLVPKSKEVSEEYLNLYFENIKGELRGMARGGGQDNLNQSIIINCEIPVPPLEEQDHIVETIDNQLNRINRLEQNVSQIDSLTSEYESSLLAFLFSGEENTSESSIGQLPNNETIPENWDLKNLSEVANVNPRISLSDSDTYAYVPMDAVSAEEQKITYIDTRDSIYSGLAKFEKGDIVVARITPCFENGKMAIVGELPEGHTSAVGSTEFVVIRPDNIIPEFLFTYLKSPIVQHWGRNRLLGATGRERIKISQFRNELLVPVPPKDEQRKIVNEHKRIDVNSIGRAITDVEGFLDEYRRSVLDYGFRGELTSSIEQSHPPRYSSITD